MYTKPCDLQWKANEHGKKHIRCLECSLMYYAECRPIAFRAGTPVSCTICCSDVTVCMPAVTVRVLIFLLRIQCWSSLNAMPGAASQGVRTQQTVCRSSNSAVMLESFQVLFGLLQEILLQCSGLHSAVSPLQTYAAGCASANSECATGLPVSVSCAQSR